tara:strand:+ start:1781 stop:3541 length:1761 start_codon:yes stop_codon:yes gene_type:complete
MNNQLLELIQGKSKRSGNGFILLGSAMAIFLILSIFSIYLLKIVVSENTVSNYNLLDIKTRNLMISGIEYGTQRFLDNSLISEGTISKTMDNGNFIIEFNPSTDQEDQNLPYTHFAMLNSSAIISDVSRDSRIFLSSYPNIFNLAFFGNNSGSGSFNQSGGNFDGDIHFNGTITNVNLSPGKVAYNYSGNGGQINYDTNLDFPNNPFSYFVNLLNSAPNTVTNNTTSSSTIFYDFEDGWQGWSQHQVQWRKTWGRRTTSGTNINFGTGNALGTINNGRTYGAEHSYVQSPVFNSTGGGTITFNSWANNEYCYWDAEYMEISYNGGSNWSVLINNCDGLWSNSNSKKSGSATIPASSGTANTRIRFRYNTRDGCCGNSFGFFIDNVSVPTQQSTPVDYGIVENMTINLSQDGAIISNGPYISNQVLTFTNKMTFNNCTITGIGKIINRESIEFSNCDVGGGIEIMSLDEIIIKNGSSFGNNVESLNSSVVSYSKNSFEIDNSTFYGIIFSKGDKTHFKNGANVYGAIHSEAANCIVESNSTNIIGSLVSKYSLSFNSGNIRKGDLPKIFGNNYGISGTIVPGSYLEY